MDPKAVGFVLKGLGCACFIGGVALTVGVTGCIAFIRRFLSRN